jgi:signal peptidase I
LIVTAFGILLLSVLLWAAFLSFGLQWAKVTNVSTWRVVLATAVATTLQIIQNALFFSVPQSSIGLALVELLLAVVVPCAVIKSVFAIQFKRAIQAWVPTLLSTIAMIVFALLVLKPFFFEVFSLPANSMAPTLVGTHWKGTCSECGKTSYCSPRDPRSASSDPPLMICDDFHVNVASNVDKHIHPSDRFVVAKFLSPKRWDLVVFQHPGEPKTLYVKRLVGLPGEKVVIQEGSIWIDGERISPPDALRGIEFLSELPFSPNLWGSADRPAQLGSDEYFVLGDFSAQSTDSRTWERGAANYHPFAVPKSHVRGIGTHTIWPYHRWRIHR